MALLDFSKIPVIDLSKCSDPKKRQELLVDLKQAITSIGFLYVSNHGVPDHVIEAIVTCLPRLFALSPEHKNSVALENSPHFLGYSGTGSETTAGKIDKREQFEFATELENDWRHGQPLPERLKGPNQWPDAYPALRPLIQTYLSELTKLSERFLHLVAQSFALPPAIFIPFLSDQHRLKLIHYPPSEAGETQGVGPHKDSSGWWTFLLQASPPRVRGLQVLNKSGDWIDVPNVPGTFVVNIGQGFEVVTNGVCKATTHRVVSGSEERFSIPFFQGMRRDLTKEEAVGTLRHHFEGAQFANIEESSEGCKIDSAFLKGRYNTWGEAQLRTKIRSHQDVGRKFYGEFWMLRTSTYFCFGQATSNTKEGINEGRPLTKAAAAGDVVTALDISLRQPSGLKNLFPGFTPGIVLSHSTSIAQQQVFAIPVRSQHATDTARSSRMRLPPSQCEWFRGCPNQALIYYAFSDKWLCDYCIGYARIGLVRCSQDGLRKGVCVDTDTQNWFCTSHGRQCEAQVMRPESCHYRGSHRCPRRATTQDRNHQWWCTVHQPVRISAVTLQNEGITAVQTPNNSHTSGQLASLPHSIPLIEQNEGPPSIPVRAESSISTPSSTRWLRYLNNACLQVTPRAILSMFPRARNLVDNLLLLPTTTATTLTFAATRASSYSSGIFEDSSTRLSHSSRRLDSGMKYEDLESLMKFSSEVQTECCICMEVHRSMRQLHTCGHMFCENCLVKQIHSIGAWRYNCALCRRGMYEHVDIDETF